MSDEPQRERSDVVSCVRPKRWWNDLRWITAGVITIPLAFLAWGLFGPEPPIRVSRETTYFTEPLAADGLPDYRAALLALAGPAPPPEENAAAGLLQVCWPLGIPESHLPTVCEALGIPCVAPARLFRKPFEDAASKITREAFVAASERPWTHADLPELAAWLSEHEATVNQIISALDRPRYWLPSPSLLRKETGPVIECHLQGSSELYSAANILKCRAMWHLGEGRHAEAWRNVRAIYRLAQLLGAPERRAESVMKPLVAGRLEAIADEAMTHALLADEALPSEVLTEIRRELEGFGRSGRVKDLWSWERAQVVDFLVFTGCREPGGRAERGKVLRSDLRQQGHHLEALLIGTCIDWNEILKQANGVFDNYEAACERPTFAERKTLLEQAESAFTDRARSWRTPGGVFTVLCNRGARSDCVGARSLCYLMPALSAVMDCGTRDEARFTLVQTAAALAAWRLDHKPDGDEYPARLDELVPTYLSAIPIDPFSDKPLISERRGDGYLLASVDEDCIFDGGYDADGWIVKGEWQSEATHTRYTNGDDVVVRMPVPKRPFAKRETR